MQAKMGFPYWDFLPINYPLISYTLVVIFMPQPYHHRQDLAY